MGLNLESTISLNSASFERGMHRVKESVADSIKSFAIGAIGVATVEEAFRRTIETADELVNTAKRLGTTVEQVQLLRQAAKDAGTEMDSVATALEKINQARAKALGGDRAASAAFGALGVSQTDLKTKRAADLFMHEISETVKKVSPEQIAQPLREVLGRGAGQGIAVLKTDFDELGRKMQGFMMSGEVAEKLKKMSDNFELLGMIFIKEFSPVIVKVVESFLNLITGTGLVGKAFESLIFLIKKNTDDAPAGLNGYSSKERSDTAIKILDLMQKFSPEKAFKLTGKESPGVKAIMILKGYSDVVNSRLKGGPFEDFKGKSGEEFFHYLQQIIQKQSDFTMGAAKGAEVDVADLRNWVKNYGKGDGNPKPDFSATADVAKKMRGNGRIESDSLVRVGNFLGSNIGAVHSAARMEQYSKTTVELLRGVNQTLKTIQVQLPTKNFGGNGSLDGGMKNSFDYSGIMSLMNIPNH